MFIKVYTGNKNKVDVIVCGSRMYENFKNAIDAKNYIGHHRITTETKILKDEYMKPNSFIGMDENKDWVFSCL